MREQFFFGVPLRASATAQRWDRVCALETLPMQSFVSHGLAQPRTSFFLPCDCSDLL